MEVVKNAEVVNNEPKKNLIVRVSKEYHQELKVYLAQKGLTLQDYIINLIEEDRKKEGKTE